MTQFDPDLSVETFPITPSQAVALSSSGSDAVLKARWDVRGEAPSALVHAALNDVVARHEVLRTAFLREGADARQVVLPATNLKLDTVDLRALPIDDHAERLDAIFDETAARPFDLGAAPLLRATLVRTAPERAALLLAVHRAILDDTSVDVLGNDLAAAMRAHRNGTVPDWPDLALHYADYALWVEACQQDASHAHDRAFWRRTLNGGRITRLSADRPGTSTDVARHLAPLPPRFGQRLEAAARALETEAETLLVAATTSALSRCTRGDEVLFVCEDIAQREDALGPLIGAFSNPLALRLETPPDLATAELLSRVAQAIDAARAHASVAFEDARGYVADADRAPETAWVGLSVQETQAVRLCGGGFSLEQALPASDLGGRSLRITFARTASGHALLVDYDAGQYSSDTACGIATEVQACLDDVLDGAPRIRLGGIADAAPKAPTPPMPPRNETEATWTLVPLREGSETSPVIIAVSQPHLYRNFAESLHGDVTTVGLAVLDDASLARQAAMGYDAMVDEAVALLESAFPDRPVALIGQCVDGVTAMHIAQRASARDADICLAALVDAWAPRPTVPSVSRLGQLRRRVTHSAIRLAHYLAEMHRGRMRIDTVLRRLGPGRRLLRLMGRDVEAIAGADLLLRVNHQHVALANHHIFPGWDGEVISFASDSQPRDVAETTFGWKALLRCDTPVFRVSGWHEDALQYASYGHIAQIVEARLRAILAARAR
ncbi:MAG: condensation domain-containing protein [Pseudomonadota bacterium]